MFSFESIKTNLLKKKTLFEDPDFPANYSSLGKLKVQGNIVWKRPKEINPDAKFVVNKTSRFDLIQGSLADCWFVSAAACLAAEDPALLERCVNSDQSLEKDYAGIFKFSFWNFGSWEDVYIDDRLPTDGKSLVFARNDEEPNEFWVPLFEKAYAKLKGNYSDLDGGQTTYALVDFTGGITERIDLKESRIMSGKLFDIMVAITSKSSLMGCDIIARNGIFEGKLPTGLYTSHAYAITDILTIQTKYGARPVKLLRVRNPWGEGEWNGDWSDNSPKWNSVSEKDKTELQLMKKDNGEFWMSYDDWLNNFDYLTICHLEPSSVTAEIAKTHGKSGWETISFFAEWIAGYNAGGSSMFSFKREKFFSNPQFRITLKPLADHDRNGPTLCHLIVSLMQMTRSWDEQDFIAFDIYQVRNGVPNPGEGKNYSANELTFVKKGNTPVNLREVATHFELPPGDYIIIPFTLEANKNGKFLLRIYVEFKDEENYNPPTTLIPQKPTASLEETSIQKSALDIFSKAQGGKKDMDAQELFAVLDQFFKTEGIPSGFTSREASRCLVSLHGHTQPGLLTANEFVDVWKETRMWIDKFLKFDTDKSGTIDCYELDKAFVSVGIQLSREAIEAIVCKYGGRQKKLTAAEFILCSCKITHIYDHFKKLSGERKLQMPLEEWMSMTLAF